MNMLLVTLCMVYPILLLAMICYVFRCYRNISKLKTGMRDRIQYIRILIENVYTYNHDPNHLLDHLLKEMTIGKLLCYHIVDEEECPVPVHIKCTKKDRLLYQLHMDGFSPKELCILFELNSLNTVYVKCYGMNEIILPGKLDNNLKNTKPFLHTPGRRWFKALRTDV